MTSTYIDPTAEVSPEALVGEGSIIWNWTKVRESARIGNDVSIGQHCYIGHGVVIGCQCKIQNGVNIYNGVTVGDEVFIGPSVTFTNDLHPRVVGEWSVVPTVVGRGASIGANATIICGVTLGQHCMVAAGAVVTRDVPDYALVMGVPARIIDYVNKDGSRRHVKIDEV